ncbi:acyl carrier protein [Paenibacillus sp. FSL P2-0136]|uniref:acyl carrier protein n=1 Tax=Paenibacillus sp. FSL P2-0136 TaxID=2975317 RepID=UPI0030D8F914
MSNEKMESDILLIIMEETSLKVDQISGDATIRSLGIDSLILAEVITSVEEKYGAKIDMHQIMDNYLNDISLKELTDAIVQALKDEDGNN